MDIIVIVTLNLVCECIAAYLFVRAVVMGYVPAAIINMITHPTENVRKAIQHLAVMILSAEIETDRKVKNENGKEVNEKIPLMIFVGREVVGSMVNYLDRSKGGKTAANNAQIEAAIAQAGGDWNKLLPVAIQSALGGNYGLALAMIMQKLFSGGASMSGGGGAAETSSNNLRIG